MKKSVGEEILESLEGALAHATGKDVPVRETTIYVPADIDVKSIRERLGLSQSEFAVRFGFSIGAVRHWEQGRRQPDGPARAYLKVIGCDHVAVEKALAAL